MRVIAGSAGGLTLQVPRDDVRPTMDRVKAAIFSSLRERLPGARVLDLFAGSGGLGIEALSRGAASSTFVEHSREANEVIRANLRKTKLTGRIEQADVFRYLQRAGAAPQFDLIFADPPYKKQPGERDFANDLLQNENLPAALAPDGLLVLENMPGTTMESPAAWESVRQKRYGATEVFFYRLRA